MMTVKTFVVNPLQQNTYVLSCPVTREAVMIDCGTMFEREEQAIARYIKDEGLTLRHVLLTHAHFDHASGVPFAWSELGVSATLSRDDEWLYRTMGDQVKRFLRADMTFNMPTPAAYIKDGDTVTFGQCTLQVLATPGHTPGGLSFYSADDSAVWAGDCLFPGSVGRTDLEGGNHGQLISAINDKLMTLPASTTVYTGHGPSTTVEREKMYNPYLSPALHTKGGSFNS